MSASPPDSTKSDYTDELADRLHDQTIEVPDLIALYGNRIVRENSDVDVQALRQHLEEEWFQPYIPTESQRSGQRRINIAYCASLFYPNVSATKLKPLARLLAWLCYWDDEVDSGTITQDQEKIQAYCADSIAFIRSCFQPELGIKPPAPGRLHNCGVFVDIAEAMKSGQSRQDRDCFVQALVDFIRANANAAVRNTIGLPPVEEYIHRREDTIGFAFVCHSMKWAHGLSLPTWLWENQSMKCLIHEVLTGIWLANDIISLSKEIKSEQYDSIIPILMYHEDLSVHQAVKKAVVRSIQSSCGIFTTCRRQWR
jgi:hypothetical protein